MKLPSLLDLFKDTILSVALLTETWLKGNYCTVEEMIKNDYGLDIIAYNRPGKKRGGGMAIVFDPAEMTLTENKFKREGAEVVSAVGKLAGDTRIFVFYSVYLPPNLSKAKVERSCEIIAENIVEMKTRYNEPYFFICGDFNQFGVDGIIEDLTELRLSTPPLQGTVPGLT